jgi:hypothetical protein
MSPEREKASGALDATENGDRKFSDFLVPLLTAIGTGIGVLGFVMFFGGFILWARFKAGGLPANEAVAKVPRNDLVATGASFLVPGILAALGLVVCAYAAWDHLIERPRRKRLRSAQEDYDRATEQLADLETRQRRLERRKEEVGRREQATIAKKLALLTREEIPAQREAKEEAEEDCHQIPARAHRKERVVGVAILVAILLFGGLYLIPRLSGLSFSYLFLLAAVIVGSITATVVVASRNSHFAWVMLCVFLSVGITIAAINYVRTQTHPKLSPVAALSGHSPVVGFFVAETDDALYVGRPQPAGPEAEADQLGFDRTRATLIRLPKASLSNLTIGPLMDEDKAYRRSLLLAMALCRRAAAAATGPAAEAKSRRKDTAANAVKEPPAAATPVPCSSNETDLLENRLERVPGKRR